jgi:PAS domain S-box-containing protein
MPAHHPSRKSQDPVELEKLFAAEETFRAIAEVTQAGLYILEGTRFVYVNAAAEKISGYTQEELLGMDFFDIIHPESHQEVRERWQARLRGDMVTSRHEVKMVTKSGAVRWAEYTLTPLNVAGKSFLLGTAYDITEGKEAQTRIQKSHELLRNLIDGMGPYMFVGLLTPDGALLEANRPALEAAGLRLNDVLGKPVADTYWFSYSEEARQRLISALRRAAAGEVVRYDEQIRVSANQLIWIDFAMSPLKDETGAVRYIVPSAIVITERKQAEDLLLGQKRILEMVASGKPLPETLTSLVQLIESHAPGMLGSILLLDEDGVHVRHGAAPSLPAEYVAAIDGQPIGPCAGSCGTAAYRRESVFVEDIATDALWATYKAAALPHGLRACWSTPIFDAQRRVLGTFAMYYRQPGLPQPEHLQLIELATHTATIAISRWRAMEALRKSEEKFSAAFQVSPSSMAILTADEGRTMEVNEEFTRLTGYAREEVIGRTVLELNLWAFPEEREHVLELLRTRSLVSGVEIHVRHKSGRILTCMYHAAFVNLAGQKCLLAIAHDTTERKRAEAERDRLFNLSVDMLCIAGFDGFFKQLNPAWSRALGWSLEELLARSWLEFVHPEDRDGTAAASEKLLASEPLFSFENRYQCRDGSYRWLSWNAFPLPNEQLIFAVVRDITERKRAEQVVRESEERLRLALDAAHMGTFDWDIANNRILWSRWHEELWGFAPGEFGGTYEAFASRVHPEDLPGLNDEVARCMAAQESFLREFRVVWPNASVHWVLGRGQFTYDDRGEAVRMRGVVVETTARRQAQDALQKSEARLRNLFDQASDGIFLISSENRYLEANARGLEMLGYTRDELLQMSMADVLVPEERPRLNVEPANMMAGQPHLAVWEHLRKDGTTFPAEVSARRLDDQTYLAIVRDLTARRQAEQLLREREQQLRLFVEHSPAAIAMFDRNMKYLVASRRYLTDYRIEDQEIIGRSHYEVFPEIPARWKETHRRCLAGAIEKSEEDPFPRKDGTTDWVRWEIRPWYKSQTEIGGLILFSEVVTERVRAEEELRELTRRLLRAQEEERGRIARELHDSLGQSLAAIALALGQAGEAKESIPEHSRKWIADARKIVAECSQQVRTLSHLLHPPLLDELGLLPAMRSFVRGFSQRSGIATKLELEEEMERLPPPVELALFRVLQESLNNVQRHSGSKTAGVTLRRDANRILLEISDEGRGLRGAGSLHSLSEEAEPGVGILGMRERLRQLGGSLEIESGKKGTTVRAILGV